MAFLIFFMSLVRPIDTHANGAFVRIVGGTVGERVLIGTMEKFGVKYVTKDARKRAVEKWNLELYNKIKEQTDVTDLTNLHNQLTKLTDTDLTAIPDKPGFGKYIVNTGLFISGADVIYDIYKDVKESQEQQKVTERMKDTARRFETGESYASFKGAKFWIDAGGFKEGRFGWTTTNSTNFGSNMDATKPYWGEITSITDYAADRYVKVSLVFYHYWMNQSSQSTDIKQGVYINYPDNSLMTDFSTYNSVPNSTHVPEVTNIPWLDIYLDTGELPANIPETVEVVVPMTDGYPETTTEPWNLPQITFGDSTAPNPDEGADPAGDLDKPFFQTFFDWLKKLLTDILAGITSIYDFIKDILQKILDGILSIPKFLNDIWTSIKDILNYLNPLHENFFLKLAFVPADGYFTNFFNEIHTAFKAKIPFIAQILDFLNSIKNASVNGQIPEFKFTVTKTFGGGTYHLLSFEYFTEYRDIIINFIRFTAWFIFLKRLFRRIPKVVY